MTTADSTTTSTLSDWAGPYVTNMLGKTQALAGEGYQMYDGPLTAGSSQLQNQAFQGIGGLTMPTDQYSPTSYGGSYTAGTATPTYTASNYTSSFAPTTFSTGLPGPNGVGSVQDYMNPYLQGVLDPQIRELNRQQKISQMGNADRFAQAGAYGGSRQAIMDAELQRNLLQNVGDVTGKTYASAYDNAQNQQYKAAQLGLDAQKASEQSRQFGATNALDYNRINEGSAQFGATNLLDTFKANEAAKLNAGQIALDSNRLSEQSQQFNANNALDQSKLGLGYLDQQLKAGDIQRQIEQQGLTADYAEFQKQVQHPYEQLSFMQQMIKGMPISTTSNTTAGQSNSQELAGLLADLAALYK